MSERLVDLRQIINSPIPENGTRYSIKTAPAY